MKLLISTDTNAILRKKAEEGLMIPFIEQAITAYKNMRLPAIGNGSPTPLPALTSADLPLLFSAPEILVFDKMTGGNPVSIGNLAIDKKKALEILVKPNGYDAFIQTVTGLHTIENVNYSGWDLKITGTIIAPRFELDGSGAVVFKQSYLDEIETGNSKYLTNPFGLDVKAFAEDVKAAFEARNLGSKIKNFGLESKLFNSLLIGKDGVLEVKLEGLLQFNNQDYL